MYITQNTKPTETIRKGAVKPLQKLANKRKLPNTVREVEDSFGTIGNGIQELKIMWIGQGIFQGGSLSPLLFCMSLKPLSRELSRTGYGCCMGA